MKAFFSDFHISEGKKFQNLASNLVRLALKILSVAEKWLIK